MPRLEDTVAGRKFLEEQKALKEYKSLVINNLLDEMIEAAMSENEHQIAYFIDQFRR